MFLFLDPLLHFSSGPFWDTRADEVVPRRSYSTVSARRNEERGRREVKNGEEEEKRELRVGSNTAGGTQKREVLLSGRGPLSSLSRWWQVSVAALAAEDGRHLAKRTPLFLPIASRARAAKPLRGVACPPQARRVRPPAAAAGDPDDARHDPRE